MNITPPDLLTHGHHVGLGSCTDHSSDERQPALFLIGHNLQAHFFDLFLTFFECACRLANQKVPSRRPRCADQPRTAQGETASAVLRRGGRGTGLVL